jgi:hypothetical protein
MFDRFIRLARAKKALHEQRYLDALKEALDPLVEQDRRARRICELATEQLVRRAHTCLASGDARTALAEATLLKQLVGGDAIEELFRVAQRAVEERQAAGEDALSVRGEFRRLVDAGDLTAAESLLATLPGPNGASPSGDLEAMRALLTTRRAQALALLEGVMRGADLASYGAGIDAYLQANAIDNGLPRAARSASLHRLAGAVRRGIENLANASRCTKTELVAMLRDYAEAVGKLPELAGDVAFLPLIKNLQGGIERCLQDVASLSEASDFARFVCGSGLPMPTELDSVVAALATIAESADNKPSACAAVLTQLEQGARLGGFRRLAELAKAGIASVAQGEERLEAARVLLAEGNLEAARAMFVAFLNDNPMHAGVQKDLKLVDESMADLDRRLADVRMMLRGGRLLEACTGAMALVGTARIASEAQQILSEARSRMALVDKGLDEVRVSLHGRAAATAEGVRHCLKRLEELVKVQIDHEELPKVITAVTAEVGALDRCEQASAALARADLDAVVQAIPELLAARKDLLGVERIDAKLCQMGDRVVQFGDRALADGRLAVVLRCASLLKQLEMIRGDFSTRAMEWRREHERREVAVAELLRDARSRLVDRDLADAERLVEEAQLQWRESAEVQAFAYQLQKLRKQTHTLEQVVAMAEDKDFLGAHQKLASMPSVPSMLRSRVYDIKQDLARAQGLEGSFLLRVDEGGEQLVLRGETVSIGNVRQARADLPVLANISGRHATIRRSMSFHGGMQDSITAEDGEVKVAGKTIQKHVLKSGDRVQLGPALALLYQKPSSRSLTSRLLLQSGFQVAGTDRVLLMKDRGRDGRILIGPGRDVHVSVSKATGEIEIFASNSGQMRVHCEQGGSIDGRVFRGEHPVAAGQVIEACGITFLLMPWHAMV